MFARLSGLVAELLDDALVIDVGGVGYLVQGSGRLLARAEPGQALAVLVETRVREDAITLYGFVDADERGWFRTLTAVQGVGPRVALSVLTALAPADLATALAAGDHRALARADGVGPKLAQRLVAELKDKALTQSGAAFGQSTPKSVAAPTGTGADAGAAGIGGAQEAVAALLALGYGASEAMAAVREALAADPQAATAALVRAGLKRLGQRLG